jgi:hypothetical protein
MPPLEDSSNKYGNTIPIRSSSIFCAICYTTLINTNVLPLG